jgi:hypothetical protein
MRIGNLRGYLILNEFLTNKIIFGNYYKVARLDRDIKLAEIGGKISEIQTQMMEHSKHRSEICFPNQYMREHR